MGDIRFLSWAGYDFSDPQFSDSILLPSVEAEEIAQTISISAKDLRPIVEVGILRSFPEPIST
jgi:hypothetical protein